MAEAGRLIKYIGIDGEGREMSMQLPAWALEKTQSDCLKKLDKVAKVLSKGGENFNLLAEVRDAMKGNTKAIEKLANHSQKTQKKTTTNTNNSKQNDTSKAQDALADATKGNNDAINTLKKLANKNSKGDGGNILQGLAGKAGPFSIMGNMIGKVIGVLSKFVGAIIGATVAVATFIGRQLMKTFNLFNDSLSDGTAGIIGALTTGSTNIAREASKAGLGLKEFTEAIQESSEEIAVLGAEGYRSLRNATRDMAGGLFELGFKNEEMTKILGREISIRARLGMRLDAEGTNLAGDVVRVATQLRRVGAAAGISAEELYARSKLDDETNSLIAARARELGDDGISALQTSIRLLSMEMVGVSPTYASAITTPLVNAMITGAVGLDDNFTDLVSVFPGLVKSFDMAKNDINNSGELSADTIEGIMTSLVDTTDEEFKRARQLALMTRNQTAIQAVNFASEARAREALVGRVTQDGKEFRARNISTISAQMATFFDMLKAPFENAFMQFTMNILGVSTTKDGINFGTVLTTLTSELSEWVYTFPVVGKIFQQADFIEEFNKYVNSYFAEGATAADRAAASKGIYDFVGNMIDEVSMHIGSELKRTSLSDIITDFFRTFMNDTAIMVYENTGMMGGQAAMAYARRGGKDNIQKAFDVDAWGLTYGTDIGNAIGAELRDTRGAAMAELGVNLSDKDYRKFVLQGTQFPNGRGGFNTRDSAAEMMEKHDMSLEQYRRTVSALQEHNREMIDYFTQFGFNQSGPVFTIRSAEKFIDKKNDASAKFIYDYANNSNILDTFGSARGLADQYSLSGYDGNGGAQLRNSRDMILNLVGGGDSSSIDAAIIFKNVIDEFEKNKTIKVSDGIDQQETDKIRAEVEKRFEALLKTNSNFDDGDLKERLRSLVIAVNRLTLRLHPDN